MPARVSALKSVDLPTLGRPTMPHLRLMAFLSFVCSASIARSKSPAAIAGHASSARSIAASIAVRSSARGGAST